MIDSAVIIAYFVFVLIVGIHKGSNIKSVREYAIANKNYSLPILVATLTATGIGGGSTLGLASAVVSIGFVYVFILLGRPLSLFLVAQFLVNKFEVIEDCISVGALMGKFYGKWAQIITGGFGAMYCVAAVGGQVSAIGFVAHYFLDIHYGIGVFLGCGIVILYSSFGGIKSVTATDVIQFAVLIIAIPMICNIGLYVSGGLHGLLEKIPSHLLELPKAPQMLINYFFIFLGFAIPFLDPPTMQRLLMARNLTQTKRMLNITVLIEIPLYLFVGVIGLIAACNYPELEANIVLPHLINSILPLGLKGIAVIGLFSVIMSTADSYLNAAGIALVQDTIKPLFNLVVTDKFELRLTQVVTFVLGSFAAIIALSFSNILSMVLFSLNFWGPVIVVPLYAILLGYRASTRCFFAGALSGIITFVMWTLFVEPHSAISSLIPGMVANAIGFIVAFVLERKYAILQPVHTENNSRLFHELFK